MNPPRSLPADPPNRGATASAYSPDETLARLVRERDNLFLLHEALAEVEQAATLEARLRIFVQAIQRIGFGRVAITLRDAHLNPTAIVTAGLTAEEDRELRATSVRGVVWRRRLTQMERFRIGSSYYLDSRDPWVASEFGDGLPSQFGDASEPGKWAPGDCLLVPLKAGSEQIIGTLVLDDPLDRATPSLARVRTVELFAQQVASIIEHARLVELAEHRAERLQHLQAAGRALASSLDEVEIVRELLQQVHRLVPGDACDVAACDEHGDPHFLSATAAELAADAVDPEVRRMTEAVLRDRGMVRSPERAEGAEPECADPDTAAPSAVGVPALSGASPVAVVVVRRRAGGFTEEELEVLQTVGAHAGSALSNARRYAESMAEQRRSEAITDITRAVSASLRLDDVSELIMRHAMALLRAEGANLAVLRDDALHAIAGAGPLASVIGMRVPLHGSVIGRALRLRAPVICNDPDNDPEVYRPTRELARVSRLLGVPLLTSEGPIGVLSVANRATPFTEEDASVLQRLADQVAVVLVNARLFEEHRALAERYRRVLETTNDAIIITDGERRITFTNPAADALIGVPGTPAGMQLSSFAAAELQERVSAHEERTLSGESQRYESVLVRADGERRMAAVSTAPLRSAGQVSGIVASLRDITDERRARDAVAQSEARYRNLFESATDAIYTVDGHGCFTSVNAATCRLSGLTREELLGRSALPLLATADVSRVREHFKSALAGSARHYECQFVRNDGTRRLLSVTNTPIRHGQHVVGILGVARDVTDERERAQALQRSEARYTRLVEAASDAIFTVDTEGLLTSVNRSLERSVGRRRTELLSSPFALLVDSRDQGACMQLLQDTMAGERKRADLRYHTPSGELRACSIMTTPLIEDGKVTGALGIVRDVTEEKRLTEQLMQQEKLAAVGQLVSGVAHELNNPLAGVMAFSQLLLASPSAQADQRRAIEAIHQEAKRAAKIVSNLLTFARQHQPERTFADLNRVVTDTLELRRYALRVHQVEVDLRLDALLPLTWADPFQLQQVVLNLLTNAEQALADWSGERRIVLQTARSGDTLVIRISDSGPGITTENLPRVFNPFFTTKPVGQGTGLGLSISDGIVREHGGRIRADSRLGQGATFVIELPHVAPPPPGGHAAESATLPRASGLRLLVVDDEPAIRNALTTFLGSLGHVVDAVGSGREALERAAVHEYHGVVLDLRMPDMSGDAVFRALQERASPLADRVVFLTGDIQSESARRFLEDTGRPVVTKPFLLDELAAVLLAEAER